MVSSQVPELPPLASSPSDEMVPLTTSSEEVIKIIPPPSLPTGYSQLPSSRQPPPPPEPA